MLQIMSGLVSNSISLPPGLPTTCEPEKSHDEHELCLDSQARLEAISYPRSLCRMDRVCVVGDLSMKVTSFTFFSSYL